MHTLWKALGTVLLLTFLIAPLRAGGREVRTLEFAVDTVRALGGIRLRGIPANLLRDAAGVAVIPHVVKAGFLVDGRFGRGVVLARQPDGNWSNPIFITLAGGGFGFQAGVESTDIVLVFRTRHSLDRILKGKGKLTLGADISIAAGPVGREAEAATDARLKAEIYSYSRSRGLFAGVSLEGAGIMVNRDANERFYGLRDGAPGTVLGLGAVPGPAIVDALKTELNVLAGTVVTAPGAVIAPAPFAGEPIAPGVPLPPPTPFPEATPLPPPSPFPQATPLPQSSLQVPPPPTPLGPPTPIPPPALAPPPPR